MKDKIAMVLAITAVISWTFAALFFCGGWIIALFTPEGSGCFISLGDPDKGECIIEAIGGRLMGASIPIGIFGFICAGVGALIDET